MPKEPEEDEEGKKMGEKTIGKDEKVLFINLEKEAQRREELNIRNRNEVIREPEKDIPKEYKDFKD